MSKATVLSPSHANKTIHLAHTAAVAADDVLLLNGRVLIAYSNHAANESGQWYFQCDEIEHAKAAVAILAGQTAYWDNAASVFTNVVGTNTKCGVFRKAQLAGDASCNLRLDNTVNL